MKNKTKKWIAKTLISTGSISTIVAPVAFSVSFASNSSSATNQISSLGALASKLKGYLANRLTPELLKKVQESNFYKSNLKLFSTDKGDVSYWRINSNNELNTVLTSLATSMDAFNDQEKLDIASEIINDFYTSNIMSVFGLDKNITNTYQAVQNSSTGINGFISDWHLGKSDRMNYRVFDLVGKDALAYYKSSAFISNQFINLYRDSDNFVNGDLTTDNNLVNFFAKWNNAIDTFYSVVSFNDFNNSIGSVDNDFKFIQKFSGDAPKSEDEAYIAILKSPIAKKFYTDERIANAEKSYNSTSARGKGGLQISLLSDITSYLLDLGQKSLATFKEMVTSTSPFALKKDAVFNQTTQLISDDMFLSLMSFAKPLAKYSKNGTSDVEIRIINPIFQNSDMPMIGIRSGHTADQNFTNILQNSNIIVPQYPLEGSDLTTINRTLDLNKVNHIEKKTINWINKQNVDVSLPNITADQKAIMWTDYAIYYAMRLKINGQLADPALIVYENDHDDDNALKNINEHRAEGALQDLFSGLNIAGSILFPEMTALNIESLIATGKDFLGLIQGPNNTVIWSTGVKNGTTLTGENPYISIDLVFNRQEYSTDWSESKIESTGFSELTSQIKKIYTDELNAWKTLNPVEDPSSTYNISMKIKTIVFPQLRFQTFDDSGWDNTHSDYFRFSGAQIFYDFTVDEITQ